MARFSLHSEQIFCYRRSQIGPSPRSQYTELANGSLLLKPLSKDHHGGWECLATNRVATVGAGTVVMVLGEWRAPPQKKRFVIREKKTTKQNNLICLSGTSPHAVSSVNVTTEMNQANVSWVPGFDGGYTQKFTVWSVAHRTLIRDAALLC